jgi:hypothetical protein
MSPSEIGFVLITLLLTCCSDADTVKNSNDAQLADQSQGKGCMEYVPEKGKWVEVDCTLTEEQKTDLKNYYDIFGAIVRDMDQTKNVYYKVYDQFTKGNYSKNMLVDDIDVVKVNAQVSEISLDPDKQHTKSKIRIPDVPEILNFNNEIKNIFQMIANNAESFQYNVRWTNNTNAAKQNLDQITKAFSDYEKEKQKLKEIMDQYKVKIDTNK